MSAAGSVLMTLMAVSIAATATLLPPGRTQPP